MTNSIKHTVKLDIKTILQQVSFGGQIKPYTHDTNYTTMQTLTGICFVNQETWSYTDLHYTLVGALYTRDTGVRFVSHQHICVSQNHSLQTYILQDNSPLKLLTRANTSDSWAAIDNKATVCMLQSTSRACHMANEVLANNRCANENGS